jgi:hypothetical protein
MLEQLRRSGVKIEKVEDYDYGRWLGSWTRKAIASSYGNPRENEDAASGITDDVRC